MMRKLSNFVEKSLLITGFSILLSTVAYSQYEPLVIYNIPILEGMQKAEEGTYQITINPKFSPVFTDDILYFIEQKRKDNEDVVISLMYCADVFIPSRNKINSPSFVPLQSTVR